MLNSFQILVIALPHVELPYLNPLSNSLFLYLSDLTPWAKGKIRTQAALLLSTHSLACK